MTAGKEGEHIAEVNRRDWGRKIGRASVRYDSPVQRWLGEVGGSARVLAADVSGMLRRDVSRAAMQTWIAGRQVSRGKVRPATAPLDVRRAVEELSAGQIRVTDWPHVSEK